jgi:hypothetical protein
MGSASVRVGVTDFFLWPTYMPALSHLSACSQGRTQLPTTRFWRCLIEGIFTNICLCIPVLVKINEKIIYTLHENPLTFMTILVTKDTTVVMFNKVTNVPTVTRTHQKGFALWTFPNLLHCAPIYKQVFKALSSLVNFHDLIFSMHAECSAHIISLHIMQFGCSKSTTWRWYEIYTWDYQRLCVGCCICATN